MELMDIAFNSGMNMLENNDTKTGQDEDRRMVQYKLNLSFAAIMITANIITFFYLMIQPTRKTTYYSMYISLLLTTVAWTGTIIVGGYNIMDREDHDDFTNFNPTAWTYIGVFC